MDSAAAPVPYPVSATAPLSRDSGWLLLRWGVVALALVSRLWWLDLRPPHFDEGVNGWFTDQMRHLYCYQYDPSNYHGPLHFYVLFLFKQLLGRNVWALRLPTAIVGVLSVEWCFRFERFLGRRTSAWTAVAMLVSPATLYFQRDAIHEAWLLFFLVLGFWGICGLCQEGAKKHLWATGLAFAGMVLTKETYIIHLGCLMLAGICVFFAELMSPSRRTFILPEKDPPHAPPPLADNPVDDDNPPPRSAWITLPENNGVLARFREAFPPQQWSGLDLLAVGIVVVALIIFFYSGNFLHWPGVEGLVTAYSGEKWGKKAVEGEGHSKPFMYWCQLILRNEPWVLWGLFAAAVYAVPAFPRAWRRQRCAAIAAAALGVAGVIAAHAWDNLFAHTPEHTIILNPAARWCLPLAGLIALAGAACVALPSRREWWLRLHASLSVAACVGVLFLPWVYPEPNLFTPVLIGLGLATAALALPAPGDWRVRLLAIYGLGVLVAYSKINYKTPWCVISLIWPFFFTGAAALEELATSTLAAGRDTAMALGAAAATLAASFSIDLNYRRPTDEDFHAPAGSNASLVYVQSFDDVWTVTDFMLNEARANPSFLDQDGVILCDSTYPLPWLLGDFRHLGYYSGTNSPTSPDGYRVDFLLVSDKRVGEVEPKLDDDYYKQPIKLRPALEELQLYLRASRFAHLMPADREPEFHPVPEAAAIPANPDIGVTVPMSPGTESEPDRGLKDDGKGQRSTVRKPGEIIE